MIKHGVSDRTSKALIRRIYANVKETKVRTTVTTTKMVNTSKIGPTTTSNGITMVTGVIRVGHMFTF